MLLNNRTLMSQTQTRAKTRKTKQVRGPLSQSIPRQPPKNLGFGKVTQFSTRRVTSTKPALDLSTKETKATDRCPSTQSLSSASNPSKIKFVEKKKEIAKKSEQDQDPESQNFKPILKQTLKIKATKKRKLGEFQKFNQQEEILEYKNIKKLKFEQVPPNTKKILTRAQRKQNYNHKQSLYEIAPAEPHNPNQLAKLKTVGQLELTALDNYEPIENGKKSFPIYDDSDLFKGFDEFHHDQIEYKDKKIARDQDEDVETDEEILESNKKQCLFDLRRGISEFLSSNPLMFVRNYTRKCMRDRKDKADDDTSPAEKTYGDEDSGQDGYFS